MRFREPRLLLTFALLLMAILVAILLIDRPLSMAMRTIDPQLRSIAEWVTAFGRSTVYLVSLAIAAMGLIVISRFDTSHRRKALAQWWAWVCIYLFLAVAIPGILNDVVKLLVGRPRPTVEVGHLSPFSFGYDFQSFPSGHAAVAFGLAFGVAALWPRWRWPMLLFAAAVAASRIVLDAHYLGDVIASALLALLAVRWLTDLFASRGLVFRQGGDGRPRRRLVSRARSRRITPA